MNEEQKRKMAAGRARARERRAIEAEKRVSAFEAWLKRGSPTREIPTVPSRADYRLVRGSGTR